MGASVGVALRTLSQRLPLILVRGEMTTKIFAIAVCRVSSIEQLENNSLNRQRESVVKAAEELGATIPEDCWWSGSVSSKRGTNVIRKDLREMIERCNKDKKIKYVIVDEPDRFMRSIDEAAFFEVTFRQLGVTVWYASDPDLNKGDLPSKLLKFTKYLSAEGSNEERQRKSIAGQTTALKEGRYTFAPKPGYKKGQERGIPDIHPVRGPALQKTLIDIASSRVTPSQGLIDLNDSEFMTDGHSAYKMDKFRKIITDPFYAGILEINKQVQVRNENGLHEPLISKEQHLELIRIMENKKKNQSGPRKNGNPKYPLSNLVSCGDCMDKNNGRFVGLDLNNGKYRNKVYEKYRCRSCKKYLSKEELNSEIENRFQKYPVTPEGVEDLMEALEIVWKQNENQAEQEVKRLKHKVKLLNDSIGRQIDNLSEPDNIDLKQEIRTAIEKKKADVADLQNKIDKLNSNAMDDKERFLKFAFEFAKKMGSNFLDVNVVSKENRLRCKLLFFPAGFYVDANKKVYTPEISELIRLAGIKKDLSVSDKSHLVRVKRL